MTLIEWIRLGITRLWQMKARIGLAILSALVFAFLIFPFDDLSDWVSAQVSIATRNSVFVQFERLKMSLFPSAGVQLEDVFVESVSFPGLQAEQITIQPTISALISRKVHGSVEASGLLGGDVSVSLGDAGVSERGNALTSLDVHATKLSLQDVRQLAQLPVLLKGRLDMETSGQLDTTFQDQPDLNVSVRVQQLELPPSNVPTQMGDMTLPELKLSNVRFKARLNAGRILIEEGQIGGPGDDLQGTIKGTFGLNLRPSPAGVQPEFGAYSLEIDLQPSPAFKQRAGFFFSFLSGYQSGERYRMRVSGVGLYAPPNMSQLR